MTRSSFHTSIFYVIDSSGHSRFVLRIFIFRVSLGAIPSTKHRLAAVSQSWGTNARWEGNECFPEIPTHPSHNKRLDHLQFVRFKIVYLIYFQHDSVHSSFNSFAVNVGCDSARLRRPRSRSDQARPRSESAMLK